MARDAREDDKKSDIGKAVVAQAEKTLQGRRECDEPISKIQGAETHESLSDRGGSRQQCLGEGTQGRKSAVRESKDSPEGK